MYVYTHIIYIYIYIYIYVYRYIGIYRYKHIEIDIDETQDAMNQSLWRWWLQHLQKTTDPANTPRFYKREARMQELYLRKAIQHGSF